MKQNEKILVYAVTGFLAVILAVAILFGKEPQRRMPELRTDTVEVPNLLEVLERRAKGSEESTGLQAAPVDAPADEPPANPGQPLVANVQLAPPSVAAMVTEKLGLSRKDRGYRIVRARPGDSLGSLVQKWCGSTDYLLEAQGINETLSVLQVGQEVILPWVDDEVVYAAFERRSQPSQPSQPSQVSQVSQPAAGAGVAEATGDAGGAAQPAVAPAVAGLPTPAVDAATRPGARQHKVAAGESLWKIAEREVGRKQAPGFIEKIRALNPNLDVDRIRQGQTIQLPAKD